MAMFPKIQSPCPYKSQLAAIMDGDTCRMCKRVVHDLNGMDDGERVAFLSSCAEEVCVSYSFPMKPAIAAAALAFAALSPMAAAAQDAPATAPEMEMTEIDYIVVGGIKDTANIEYVQDAADAAIPMLPVAYEDDRAAPATPAPATAAPAADSAATPAPVRIPAGS